MKRSPLERFMQKVAVRSSGCWEWTAALGGGGYGQMFFGTRLHYSHRISWMLFRGDIPKSLFVCHTCDNRLCVNPEHLFVGSAKDNTRDAVCKGRLQHGETNGMSKLTAAEVVAIRADKRLQRLIADDYGVSQQQVSAIKLGLWWK